MSKVYVVCNQVGQYISRKGEWLSGRDASLVQCFLHRDQAVNQLFELGLRDITLRGKVVELVMGDSGKPDIEAIGPEPVSPEGEIAQA